MKTKISILALTLASFFTANAYQLQVEAGKLSRHLSEIKKENPTNLTLTGEMDVRDFAILKSMPASVAEFDLSGVAVAPYSYRTGNYLGETDFEANVLPPYSFFCIPATKIVLPAGLTIIGEGALASTSITTVSIPASVTKIGSYAFYGDQSLVSVTLPMNVASVGEGAFAGCVSLRNANLKSTQISVIPARCFDGCESLTNLSLPASVRSVGRLALSRTALESLSLSDIDTADDFAFADMPYLMEITLNKATRLGHGALFLDPQLETVNDVPAVMPHAVAAGSPKMALHTHLDNVESIGQYAFAGNESTSVKFGPALKSVSDKAFDRNSNISSIDARALTGNIPDVEGDPFADLDTSNMELVVTPDTEELWKAHDYWKNFKIRTELSVVTELTHQNPAISITRENNLLKVSSALPIASVEVYDPAGKILSTSYPKTEQYEAIVSGNDADVWIVKAVSGDNVKISKLK